MFWVWYAGAPHQPGQPGLEPRHFLKFTKWSFFQIAQKCNKNPLQKKVPPLARHFFFGCVAPEYTRLKVNQKLILLLNHVGILSKKLIAAVKWKPCYLFFHGTNFNGRIENTIVFYMKLIAAEVKLCYVFSVKPFSIVKSRRPELLREIDCGFCIFSREINFKSDQRRVEEYPNFYMKLIAAEWSTYIAFVQIFCCKY